MSKSAVFSYVGLCISIVTHSVTWSTNAVRRYITLINVLSSFEYRIKNLNVMSHVVLTFDTSNSHFYCAVSLSLYNFVISLKRILEPIDALQKRFPVDRSLSPNGKAFQLGAGAARGGDGCTLMKGREMAVAIGTWEVCTCVRRLLIWCLFIFPKGLLATRKN